MTEGTPDPRSLESTKAFRDLRDQVNRSDVALRECITALRAVQPLLALPRDRQQLEGVARRAEQALINHELGLA